MCKNYGQSTLVFSPIINFFPKNVNVQIIGFGSSEFGNIALSSYRM